MAMFHPTGVNCKHKQTIVSHVYYQNFVRLRAEYAMPIIALYAALAKTRVSGIDAEQVTCFFPNSPVMELRKCLVSMQHLLMT